MRVGILPDQQHKENLKMAKKKPEPVVEPTPEDLLNKSFEKFLSDFTEALNNIDGVVEAGLQELSESVEAALNQDNPHTLSTPNTSAAAGLPEGWEDFDEVSALIDEAVAQAIEEHEEQIEDAIAKAEENTEKLIRKELEKSVGKDSAQKVKALEAEKKQLERDLSGALKQLEKVSTPTTKVDPAVKTLEKELASALKQIEKLEAATDKQLIAKAKAVNFSAVTSFRDLFDAHIDAAVEYGEKAKVKYLKELFKEITSAVKGSL